MRVTVFETALPFFGVTVTVTRHEPAFRPFTEVTVAVQIFADDAATFRVTRDPEATVSPAYFAIAAAVTDFFVVGAGAAGAGAAVTGGDVTGGEVDGGVVVLSTCGATVAGGDVAGGDVAGGEVAGGDVAGGEVGGTVVSTTDNVVNVPVTERRVPPQQFTTRTR